MGSCCIAQGDQLDALRQPRGNQLVPEKMPKDPAKESDAPTAKLSLQIAMGLLQLARPKVLLIPHRLKV